MVTLLIELGEISKSNITCHTLFRSNYTYLGQAAVVLVVKEVGSGRS